MLSIENLHANYDDVEALKGVSIQVGAGESVCLVGANGAGKSTLLKAISGLLTPKAGRIKLEGHDLVGLAPERIVKLGVAHIQEGRQIFPQMSVLEHLEVSYHCSKRSKQGFKQALEPVFNLLTGLRDKQRQTASSLSGGQQQMLVIGMALMTKPKLLLVDEPTLGLAPLLAHELLMTIGKLRQEGISVLLVEQNVLASLRITNRGYVMEDGKIVLAGTSDELQNAQVVKDAYLGAPVSFKRKSVTLTEQGLSATGSS